MLKFISKRQRKWSLIFFNAIEGSSTEAYQMIQETYEEMDDDQKEMFQQIVALYLTVKWY